MALRRSWGHDRRVALTPMSAQDSLWLTMDRPNNLMVIDGAMVLSDQVSLSSVKQVLDDAGDQFPVFRRRAIHGGQSWQWEDDPHFDIDQHVHDILLGGTADMRALQEFVAEQRSKPLDRERPLWHVYLVNGLIFEDGTVGCAIVSRFHHAIADGVRITQVMLGLCEVADGATVPAVSRGQGDDGGGFNPVSASTDAAAEAARVSLTVAGTATGVAVNAAGAAVEAAKSPSRLLGAMAGLVRSGVDGVGDGVEMIRHPDRLLDALELLGAAEHRSVSDLAAITKLVLTDSGSTVWTGIPGTRKAVAWSAPIPLARIKAIGRAHNATVNDVLLTAVAGGLRRYLANYGESLDEVVWMVPVNLKPFEENLPEDLGNYFALVMLAMPLNHESDDEALAEMHHRMSRIKNSDEAALTFGVQHAVSMSPGSLASFLTNFFANKAVGVLTNVPGPSGPMTFAGAPVVQIVGFAPCSGDQPMTATIFSYDGAVTVGFATDAALVPNPDVLAQLVVDVVEQMAQPDS